VQLRARRDDSPMFFAGDSGNAKADKDGVVAIEKLNGGLYDVSWFAQGRGLEDAYLKSVTQGGHDVLTNGVQVSGSGTNLEIVISVTAARVEGSVSGPD